MANIDRIANVSISLNTTGVSKHGFSQGLIVGAHAHSLARVETYTSVDDMTADGYSTTDPLFLAASAYLGQTPRPASVKIGRRKCDTALAEVSTLTAQGEYTLAVLTKDESGNVNKKSYSFTNSSGDKSAVLSGLATQITQDKSAAVTAVAISERLTLTGKSSDFAVQASSNLNVIAGTVTETIPQTMAAVRASDDDFYGIILASRDAADVLTMAAYVETQEKLFVTATAEAGAIDADVTTDVGYKLQEKNYYRTAAFYHALAATEYADAAVMARCFAIEPGGETWTNKKLAAVTADGLTETQYNAATKKNLNTFEKFRNVSITQNGKVAAGEWIDVIRFRDWLVEEIRTNVFYLLINNDKIPYTDAGIAMIESVVRKALEDGQDAGGIAPTEYDEDGNTNAGYEIEVPTAADITPNQKASRVLEGIKFTARLTGAIHVVKISGGFTYSNLITA